MKLDKKIEENLFKLVKFCTNMNMMENLAQI